MKRIAVLGSSGSIGINTLDVVREFPGRFAVESLAVHSNIGLLEKQIAEFRPRRVCVFDPAKAAELSRRARVRVLSGEEGLEELAADPRADAVMMAVSGSAALAPLLSAVEAGTDVCLANKEALVMAGTLVTGRARRSGARIMPVDSEQSAIWQCLEGQDRAKLKKILLTASGGPFYGWDARRLSAITRADALRHPRWKMGQKITIDSATLMNKGLEVIEAMHLFGVGPEKIEVVIHPEAVIHSMVEFLDGVVMAQLSVTDMRIPIQYALSYPQRLASPLNGPDFFALKALNFGRPDTRRFPCLRLAFEAAREGGTLPCVLNAANEVCVERFARGQLAFMSIPLCVEKVMKAHRNVARPRLADIRAADRWAREEAGARAERCR